MIDKQNVKSIYPLSIMQESMLFQSLMDPESEAYFEQTTYVISGELSTDRFTEAVTYLVNRHDILRTLFIHKNVSRPFQVVLKEIQTDIRHFDIRSFSTKNKDSYFEELKVKDRKESFDLGAGPLMRVLLVRVSDEEYRIIWSSHHILMDGWCMGIILHEFLEIYKSLRLNIEIKLGPAVPYSGYIQWLEEQDKGKSLEYWKNYLADVNDKTSLPLDGKPISNLVKKSVQKHSIDFQISKTLNEFGRDNSITLNVLLQTIWGIMLNKYNFTNNAVFGAVVSGRPPEVEHVSSILGLFINTIPVNINMEKGENFLNMALKAQHNSAQSMGKEFLPLAEIQEQSSLKNNLFDHILIFENFPITTNIEDLDESEYGFKVRDVENYEQTNYHLNVILVPKGDELKIKYDFNINVYSEETISLLHSRFVALLKLVAANPEILISDINLISGPQFSLIKEECQAIKPVMKKTVVDYFCETAANFPDKPAIHFNETSISYKELDTRSNALAHHLVSDLGIQQGGLVGLLADRSEWILISMLAILKSGAAYIPIDNSNPMERVQYMLEDGKAGLIITDSVDEFSIPAIRIHDLPDIVEASKESKPINLAHLSKRAYMIYTSGSTGQPKGCQLSHANLISYLEWANEYYFSNCQATGNTGLYTSLSFDLTVTSIFLPYLRGTNIRVYPQDLEIETILKEVFSDSNSVDFLKITPAHASLLPHLDLGPSNVKGVIVGGDQLTQYQLRNILNAAEESVVFNEYGPTETTVGCTVKKLVSSTEQITIGRPTGNAFVVILDQDENVLPPGMIGEIGVIGTGVGIGYFNKSDLTAEKFVDHKGLGQRIYKTGDLGMCLEDGEIIFYGRIDSQAKIRGYRIETGEVEYALMRMEGCTQAFVLASNDLLCAYLVMEGDLDQVSIANHLKKSLPAYMVPDVMIQMSSIPLTPNGKVDRNQLPEPGTASTAIYRAPETENQKKLAAIWQQLLEVEKVGLDDHFFHLGGHSLKTTILSSMIQKQFGKHIRLKQIFNTPVLENQVFLIEQGEASQLTSIDSLKGKKYYEVSFAQQRLYLLQQLDLGGTTYNIPAALEVNGAFSTEKLKDVFQAMLDRHESLRTSFHIINDKTVQRVHEEITFEVETKDISEDEVMEVTSNFVKAFDLSKAPLCRVFVGKIEDEKHILLVDMHHIISDGVSSELFIKEFSTLYNDGNLDPVDVQYKDFAEWQVQFSTTADFQRQRKYWTDRFRAIPDPVALPLKGARPAHFSTEGALHVAQVPDDLYKKLMSFSKEEQATLFMTLFSAFNVLLNKLSGQTDLVIGTPVSGRTHPDIQQTLGVFINTLALRNSVNDDLTFTELVSEIKDRTLEAFENQDFPFELLVEELEVPRDLTRNAMFDIMFILQNTGNSFPQLGESKMSVLSNKRQVSKFDLTLEAKQFEDRLVFKFEYATALFDSEFISNLATRYMELLTSLVNPELKQTRLKSLNVLLSAERDQILGDFNDTTQDFEKNATLHGLFEARAKQNPSAIALSMNGQTMSYQELDEKTNQLARRLQIADIGPNDIVGLMLGRSMEMVIGIFGVLKAGAAYMPLDPEIPEQRLKYILNDSLTKVLLTDEEKSFRSFRTRANIINIKKSSIYEGPTESLNVNVTSDNLAYVIYTSGSTGQPKGVMLNHQGPVNRIEWMNTVFDFDETDIILQKTTYTFDVSVWEFFVPLCYGAKLVLCEKEVINDTLKLIELIETEKVTSIHFVPSMFNVFLAGVEEDANKLKSLKRIFTSGEALNLESVKKHHALLSEIELHNLYGPTEASVEVTYFKTSGEDQLVPIGKPIWNTNLYILDANLNLLPPGVAGELHIAGVGLAKGYLNNELLTSEKFVPNPFSDEYPRLYKTGDLASWKPDGNIEFLGRIDHQVKIRGFRIELGDIESQLLKILSISEVAVIDKVDAGGDKYLCAYLVCTSEPNISEIRSALLTDLPEYMIPSFFVRLSELPLSASGKLDRKALPEPNDSFESQNKDLPETVIEKKLADMWQNVLQSGVIYTGDNFFERGGHSLKANVLTTRIQKEFNIQISIRDIFDQPVLKDQARFIGEAGFSVFEGIEPVLEGGQFPLSSAQHRLFVLQQFEGNSSSYNIPGIFQLKGELDADRVESVFKLLIQRHESLRTSIELVLSDSEGGTEDRPMQYVHENVQFELERFESKGNDDEIKEIFQEFGRSFDLTKAPLFRAGLITQSATEHVLMYDMHHIISDGVSLSILIEEFGALYKDLEAPLSELRIQYKDFAVWQQGTFGKNVAREQASFWLDTYMDEIPTLNLPIDFPRPKVQKFDGAAVSFQIEKEVQQKLKKLSEDKGTTLFTTLLAAYNIWLSKFSGQEDLIVGTAVAGRSHGDLEGLIGMFVNTLPLRNKLEPKSSFNDFLEKVKRNTINAFQNQDYPFADLVDQLNLRRDMSRNPLFDTMFAYQRLDEIKEKVDGLSIEPFKSENTNAKFDLTLAILDTGKNWNLSYNYSTHLFKEETIERFATGFKMLLSQIADDSNQSIADLTVVDKLEYEQVTIGFNDASKLPTAVAVNNSDAENQSVLNLFEQQAVQNPNAVAITFGEMKLTYQELDQMSNQVAHYLIDTYKIKSSSDVLVGVLLQRSEKLLAVLLGIWKAGAAYVPIDPSLPEKRIKYIVEDSNPALVIMDLEALLEEVTMPQCKIQDSWNAIAQKSTLRPEVHVQQSDVAYVIYTSGSTGQPKGCLLEHGNVFNYIEWANAFYFSDQIGNVGLYTSISFDLTITSIFTTLSRGKTLHVYEEDVEISDVLQDSFSGATGIDSIKITPAHISILKSLSIEESTIKVAIVGGEQLTLEQVETLRSLNPSIRIFNEYGPTETTVGCVVKEIGFEDDQILIGNPIANTTVLVLDAHLKPVPVGVSGELYIGGSGVGRGYLNREELTNERFLNLAEFGNVRYYKTGDLVKWRPNGELDFVGRIDEQVKIRGYRVELGEIESALLSNSHFREVTVIDRIDSTNSKYLCAYYTGEKELDKSAIVEQVGEFLPQYMIPAYFVKLDAIPLTTNGKIDRKVLPDPIKKNAKRITEVATNEVEQFLVSVWQRVLGSETIGINDNFFDLGGDSIKAIQVASGLGNKGYRIEVQDIFESPVLRHLARKAVKAVSNVDQGEITGMGPYTAIQKGFFKYFEAIPGGDVNHYNQSVMLVNRKRFDVQVLKKAIHALMVHHDQLRAEFQNGMQRIQAASKIDFELHVFDFKSNTKEDLDIKVNEMQRLFNIEKGPLLTAVIYEAEEGDNLQLIIHHLLVDGVSWRILLEDLSFAYEKLLSGEAYKFPLKTNSYLKWAKEVNIKANHPSFLRANAFWIDTKFAEVERAFTPTGLQFTSLKKSIGFDEEITTKLLKKSNRAFNTEINDLLLSAMALAYHEVFQKEDLLVSLEGHGRENILPHLDISRTVGWFTSEYPVLVKSKQDLKDTIVSTKEHLRSVPDKGIGFGMLKHLTTKSDAFSIVKNIKSQISFNYLGQFDSSISSDHFGISSFSPGDNHSVTEPEYALNINGLVAKEKLSFTFDGDQRYITKEQLEALGDSFKSNLIQIAEFCSASNITETTPSDFGALNFPIERFNDLKKEYNHLEIDKIYPLSPMQQGMLFVQMMDEHDPYFEQSLIHMKGEVDVGKVELVFNELIKRHEIIRSNMVVSDLDKPYSFVFKEKFFAVPSFDWSEYDESEKQTRMAEYMKEDQAKGFDLRRDLLMNIAVIKWGERDFRILWSFHHIIIDGWCLGILLKEFFQLYQAEPESYSTFDQPEPYQNYINWIEKQDAAAAKEYWSEILADYDATIEIPGKKVIKEEEKAVFEDIQLTLSPELKKGLFNLTKKHHITQFNIIQTVWGILLQKYNNTNQAVFGSVVSGRPPELKGVEDMVGLFINTLPVLVERKETFLESCASVQQQFNQSNKNNFLPLNEIQSLSDHGHNLVNHLIIYENYPVDDSVKELQSQTSEMDLEISGIEIKEITNYDFTLKVLPGEANDFSLIFGFNKNAYYSEQINALMQGFERMLTQVVQNPQIQLLDLNLITREEQQKMLADFNSTDFEYDKTDTVSSLFEKKVQEFVDQPALRFNGLELSYDEINKRANQVAHFLREQGIRPNDIVPLMLDRTEHMLVSILATIKAGAAYLPLSPTVPMDRLEFILEDCGASLVLTDQSTYGEIDLATIESSLNTKFVLTDEQDFAGYPIQNPEAVNALDDLVYVIYTSGSTGVPKGVKVRHDNLIALNQNLIQSFGAQKGDRMLAIANYTFDISILELVCSLLSGISIQLVSSDDGYYPDRISKIIKENNVNVVQLTPSRMNLILDEVGINVLDGVKSLILGGEAISDTLYNTLQEANNTQVYNGYGPSETTIYSTTCNISKEKLSIGKPLLNQQVVILSEFGEISPINIAGEICIGGVGLSSGYLNRVDLTNEKFIPHPLNPEVTIYKTGDLGRWLPDGNIEYLGRNDFQVKIRGFRIELGDIETKLLKNEKIKHAAVIDRLDEEQNKYLCAYYVSNEVLSYEKIKKELIQDLPDYMVPSYFIKLDALPLNASGKLNRKELPEPTANSAEDLIEATTDRQKLLVEVWQQVLNKESIGVNQSFFSVGGDSIKAIQVASRLQRHGIKLEMKDLFSYPTIEALEPHLTESQITAEQGAITGEFLVTPIQKQLFDQNLSYSNHYNQVIMLHSKKRPNLEEWRNVLLSLMNHHDALRSSFNIEKGVQIIDSNPTDTHLLLESFDVQSVNEIQELAYKQQGKLKIEEGVLVSSALFNTPEDGTHIMLSVHHLVIDGISWRVILEDLEDLMKGEALPPKSQSVKMWSEQLEKHANSVQLKKELSFWKSTEQHSKRNWADTSDATYKQSKKLAFTLTEEQTQNILMEVNSTYNTEVNDILLSALKMSLSGITGNSNHIVYMEGHGRESIYENQDISRTVGWFTSLFPIILDKAGDDIGQNIKSTKEDLRKVPNRGVGYGILRYMNSEVIESKELNSVPEILFNYLGQFDTPDSGKSDAEFSISNVGTGAAVNQDNEKETVVDISGMVASNRLNMNITFNTAVLSEQEAQSFLDEYQAQLLRIMDHCMGKEEVENTVSDFESEDLSEDELDDIMDMMDDI